MKHKNINAGDYVFDKRIKKIVKCPDVSKFIQDPSLHKSYRRPQLRDLPVGTVFHLGSSSDNYPLLKLFAYAYGAYVVCNVDSKHEPTTLPYSLRNDTGYISDFKKVTIVSSYNETPPKQTNINFDLGYVNAYEDGSFTIHTSRQKADNYNKYSNKMKRLACRKVVLNFNEGDYDE